MNSKLTLLALSIPVLAIVAYIYRPGGQESGARQRSFQNTGGSGQQRAASGTPRDAAAELEEAATELDIRLEQSRAKAASKANKEFSRSVYEGVFNSRKPEYARLFEKWQIDNQMAASALEIIRQRFLSEADASVAFFKDYKNKNRHAEAEMTKTVEDELAGQQLIQLLGPNRYRELTELEATMERSTAMKMRSNVAD